MSHGREGSMSERRSEGSRLFVPRVEDLRLALGEPRVLAALQQSLRDIGLRAAFRRLRSEGHAVAAVVEQLCGPHYDVAGRAYYLSAERVRSIVYNKGASAVDDVGEGCTLDRVPGDEGA